MTTIPQTAPAERIDELRLADSCIATSITELLAALPHLTTGSETRADVSYAITLQTEVRAMIAAEIVRLS